MSEVRQWARARSLLVPYHWSDGTTHKGDVGKNPSQSGSDANRAHAPKEPGPTFRHWEIACPSWRAVPVNAVFREVQSLPGPSTGASLSCLEHLTGIPG